MAKKRKTDTGPLDPPRVLVAACPTPRKRGWATKASAKKALKGTRSLTNRDDVKPYRCVCGCWHIGHQIGSMHRRMAKKLRRETS